MRNSVLELRQALGVTHADLATAARVTRQTISAIENGRWDPSVRVAMRIAARLGKTVEEVFYDDEQVDDDES